MSKVSSVVGTFAGEMSEQVKDLQTDAMVLALNVQSEQITLASSLESAAGDAKAAAKARLESGLEAGSALLSGVATSMGSLRDVLALPNTEEAEPQAEVVPEAEAAPPSSSAATIVVEVD